jgi:hypothetical protein
VDNDLLDIFLAGQDTATVVITVSVGTTNLALGKHATQSSTYLHAVFAVAGYAVDGNTDGKFLNKSTSTTEYEKGAWWQVDLGSKKNIKQMQCPDHDNQLQSQYKSPDQRQ